MVMRMMMMMMIMIVIVMMIAMMYSDKSASMLYQLCTGCFFRT